MPCGTRIADSWTVVLYEESDLHDVLGDFRGISGTRGFRRRVTKFRNPMRNARTCWQGWKGWVGWYAWLKGEGETGSVNCCILASRPAGSPRRCVPGSPSRGPLPSPCPQSRSHVWDGREACRQGRSCTGHELRPVPAALLHHQGHLVEMMGVQLKVPVQLPAPIADIRSVVVTPGLPPLPDRRSRADPEGEPDCGDAE